MLQFHHIGEEHRIAGHDQEACTSRGPFIRPPVSSFKVEGEGELIGEGEVVIEMVVEVMVEMVREVIVHHTPEPKLPSLSPTPIFSPDASILPHYIIIRYFHTSP